MRSVRRKTGFTLIELLVVVAIIALLISILLPSLSDAKEQAKVAKCLANMKSMMLSTLLYFDEYNDAFPILTESPVTHQGGIIENCHAGKTSHQDWLTLFSGAFYYRIQDRPLNEILMGGDVELDIMNGNQVEKRTEVPLAQCPSDKSCYQREWDSPNADAAERSSYDDVGGSYYWNFEAIRDTNLEGSVWENNGEGWRNLGRALIHDTRGGAIGTLVFYMSDPFLFALRGNVPVIGNHGKFNKHPAAYLDGHCDYGTRDTRGYCGVGWSTINANWIYKFGMARPPVYYTLPAKNCDPPRD